jgi:phosphoribosylformylglycinamidine cyclo-ligase
MPSVMQLIGALGGMDDAELRATYNGGLGMIAVVPAQAVATTIAGLAEHDLEGLLVGEVVDAETLEGARYVEAPLEAGTGEVGR